MIISRFTDDFQAFIRTVSATRLAIDEMTVSPIDEITNFCFSRAGRVMPAYANAFSCIAISVSVISLLVLIGSAPKTFSRSGDVMISPDDGVSRIGSLMSLSSAVG